MVITLAQLVCAEDYLAMRPNIRSIAGMSQYANQDVKSTSVRVVGIANPY